MTKDVINQIRYRYETGQYESVAELAREFGMKQSTLEGRIYQCGWKKSQLDLQKKIHEKLKKKEISKAKQWENMVSSRMEKDWSIIDRSLNNIAPIDPSTGEVSQDVLGVDGVELLNLLRSRKLVDDMARRSLGLVDPGTKVDITTGGQSLGDSFASAMDKLRASVTELPVTAIEQAIEAEIVDDDTKD